MREGQFWFAMGKFFDLPALSSASRPMDVARRRRPDGDAVSNLKNGFHQPRQRAVNQGQAPRGSTL